MVKPITKVFSIEQIREALLKKSFKTNLGAGVRVVYPNEVIFELLGKGELFDNNYIDEDEETPKPELSCNSR